MKTRHLTIMLAALAMPITHINAADTTPTEGPAMKNLARQHVGTNLFLFNADNQTYVPTEASAAWLDDDVTTGWPPQAGKQYYLMAFPEPQLMTNFEISSRGGSGTVSLYAGDEPAAPGAAAWTPLARNADLASVSDKQFAQPFSRFAKYLLIETDLTESAPWYSLYVYGNRPASDFAISKRANAINSDAIFGPYVNDQTAFNYSSLYANGQVTYAKSDATGQSLQSAIDDNPETTLTIQPAQNAASLIVKYDEPRAIQRVAILTESGAKGNLDLFLVSGAESANAAESLEGLSPTVSLVFDGTNPRSSVEFPAVTAGVLVARWNPADGSQTLAVREINSFAGTEIATYAVVAPDQQIAAQGDTEEYAYNYSSDGKEYLDPKDSKKSVLDPVGEFLPSKSPFVPGTLGFPPNLPPRETPLSQ